MASSDYPTSSAGPTAPARNSGDGASRPKTELTPFALPIIVIHLSALAAFVPAWFSWTNVLVMIVGVFVFGQGINLGYHRLLAHRSLVVPKWLEYFYVTLALCCMEESPGKWVSTHRRHHTFSDEPTDPHSSRRGFWWSHAGWLMFRRSDVEGLVVDKRWSADILTDRWYRTLERHWWLPPMFFLIQIVLYSGIGAAIGLLLGETTGEIVHRSIGLTVWGVLVRTVAVWHITWSVNSLTHAFGYRNYETGENSRNNWLVAILASGEGWHNNHHHDQASASNSHRWWEFDPTYWHIRVLESLGLARKVIRPRHLRHQERTAAAANEAKSNDA